MGKNRNGRDERETGKSRSTSNSRSPQPPRREEARDLAHIAAHGLPPNWILSREELDEVRERELDLMRRTIIRNRPGTGFRNNTTQNQKIDVDSDTEDDQPGPSSSSHQDQLDPSSGTQQDDDQPGPSSSSHQYQMDPLSEMQLEADQAGPSSSASTNRFDSSSLPPDTEQNRAADQRDPNQLNTIQQNDNGNGNQSNQHQTEAQQAAPNEQQEPSFFGRIINAITNAFRTVKNYLFP